MTATVVSADTTTSRPGGAPTGALMVAIEAFTVAKPQSILR
jgi:hypothetical protein